MQPYLGQIVHYHDPNVWDQQTYTTRAAIVTEVTNEGVRLTVLYPNKEPEHLRGYVSFASEPRLDHWSPVVVSPPRVTGGRLGPDQEPEQTPPKLTMTPHVIDPFGGYQ